MDTIDGEVWVKRILVPNIPEPGAFVVPEPDEAHHLLRVRRIAAGEPVEILDGKGGISLGEALPEGKSRLRIRVLQKLDISRESPFHLEIVLAIPAQLSTLGQMLPGLVQLGVQRIHLVPTSFGGRIKKNRVKYIGRLEQVCLQAIKQCGRTRVPVIEVPENWQVLCRDLTTRVKTAVLFHPEGETGMPSVVEDSGSVALIIGPEGGFSEEEVAHARSLGIRIWGMGPRTLKMETAALGACFWAQQRFGDLASG